MHQVKSSTRGRAT